MSDAINDAIAEQDLEEYYDVCRWLMGQGKYWLAIQVARSAEIHTLAKYRSRARNWQKEIRDLMEKRKTQ